MKLRLHKWLDDFVLHQLIRASKALSEVYLVTFYRIVNLNHKLGVDSRLRTARIPDDEIPGSDMRQSEICAVDQKS